jgi:hypothetical protein
VPGAGLVGLKIENLCLGLINRVMPEGSLMHFEECPRSYHVPHKVNSSTRNTRSQSYACTVSYI